jgi:hypothetical protein
MMEGTILEWPGLRNPIQKIATKRRKKAQEQKYPFAAFAPLRGHASLGHASGGQTQSKSVEAIPTDRFGGQIYAINLK